MEYNKKFLLKNGSTCHIRNANEKDAEAVLKNMALTRKQTDFLLTYSDEQHFTIKEEVEFLRDKAESKREAILIAMIDNKLVGSAGIMPVGAWYKQRHRAGFGVAIDKSYWGQGIGKALLNACIECTKNAGYAQLELEVVSDNAIAINLYKNMGFIEFGRNPKGFNSKISGFQELIYMRLEL